jgi:hypothetical protein
LGELSVVESGIGRVFSKMGLVEKLDNYQDLDNSLSGHDIKARCREVRQEIERNWNDYVRTELILHGRQVKGSEVDRLLFYLVKKGVL